MSPADVSIRELGSALRSGQLSSAELTRHALERIDNLDGGIHAFITVTAERAMTDARRADEELRAGRDRGPMHGIPYALKDIYDTAGILTTCHSKLLVDNVPDTDSEVASRFQHAGAVLLGKLATNEFAYGGPSFDLPFPPALNPWNTEHFTGGSSAGSAAAVAAGYLRMAPGSDTGGSIRGPAAWCGTVGLKPTFGLVSRVGVYPLAWSLDHCGPLARSVEDAAIGLQVMAGHDGRDPSSASSAVPDYCADLDAGVRGMRIGVPRHFFEAGADPEVLRAIRETLEGLRDSGAVISDVTLPDFSLYAACCRVLLMGEGFSVHRENAVARLGDYGATTAGRLVIGATLSAADYLGALRLRRELVDATNAVLRDYDALLTATTLQTAPRLDDIANPMGTASPLQLTPFNVTGHPAISMPVGLSSAGLPLAVQLVGRPFDEAGLLKLGRQVEKVSGWLDIPLPSLG